PTVGDGREVNGTVVIGLYSYDKDKDRSASEIRDYVEQSRLVKYTLRIRKVGNATWTTLLDRSTQDVYYLNTQQYEDGTYEIEAKAENILPEGGPYVSDLHRITIEINNNRPPEVTVLNGNEWINFYFGWKGAMSPTGEYILYQDMYAEAEEGQQEGLFVKLRLQDEDVNQYHYGRVYLEGISGAEAEIQWKSSGISNGVIERVGVAFIPKEKFVNMVRENVQVVIDVQDFRDPGLTDPAGSHVVQVTVSKDDLTLLIINVLPNWNVVLVGSDR
ncbi:MAG: hypothetical protein QMD10_10305, partial [Desulfitobacteriaceae bacterium]|nr:hypothetical protein [Desulfitobacteriaceae bacterium]